MSTATASHGDACANGPSRNAKPDPGAISATASAVATTWTKRDVSDVSPTEATASPRDAPSRSRKRTFVTMPPTPAGSARFVNAAASWTATVRPNGGLRPDAPINAAAADTYVSAAKPAVTATPIGLAVPSAAKARPGPPPWCTTSPSPTTTMTSSTTMCSFRPSSLARTPATLDRHPATVASHAAGHVVVHTSPCVRVAPFNRGESEM